MEERKGRKALERAAKQIRAGKLPGDDDGFWLICNAVCAKRPCEIDCVIPMYKCGHVLAYLDETVPLAQREEGEDWMKGLLKAATVRAIRTVFQTALGMIGAGAATSDINWLNIAAASMLAGALSLVTSLSTGLPEAQTHDDGGNTP